MLLHILAVECVYLFHKYTEKFVGEDPVDRPTPVMPSEAIDFRLLRGKNIVPYLAFQNAKKKAFDVRYGIWGTLLDYYPTHKGDNQSFLLVLRPDNNYSLVQTKKCINWSQKKNQFIKETCSDSLVGNFDIYYKISFIPETTANNDNTSFGSAENSDDINREFVSLSDPTRRRALFNPGTSPTEAFEADGIELLGINKSYASKEREVPLNASVQPRKIKVLVQNGQGNRVGNREYLKIIGGSGIWNEMDEKQFKDEVNDALAVLPISEN